MRPKVLGEASSSEMAQEEFDPLWLMSGVVMLVLEARTPDHSVKGRTEGPHCPRPKKEGRHFCSKEIFECRRAMEIRKRLRMMLENGIPTCIDILLFPACTHGAQEAQSLDGAASSVQENCILLERWTIQCIHKWHGEWTEGIGGSMLLQAVRSYLYFSQLSSWLTSMQGHLPLVTVCRLYAPGEEARVDFKQRPDSHIFPIGTNGHHGLKADVLSLPRQDHVPHLLCVLSSQDEKLTNVESACGIPAGESSPRKRGRFAKIKMEKSLNEKEAPGRQETDFHHKSSCALAVEPNANGRSVAQEWEAKTLEQLQKSEDEQTLAKDCLEMYQRWNKDHNLFGTRQEGALVLAPGEKELRERAKNKVERSSVRSSLESQLKPLALLPCAAARSLDLHSPKVLMSTELKLPRNLVTRKKRMDFEAVNDVDGEQLVSSLDHSVFFTSQLPLAPQDMQRILANLHSLGQPFAGLPACPVSLKLEKGQKTSLDCPTGTQNLGKPDVFDSCSHRDQSIHGSLSTLRTYMKSARPFATLSASPASVGLGCAGKELQENLNAKTEEEELRRMFSKLKIPPQDADVYFSGHLITCTSHECVCSQDRHSHIDGLQISDDKDSPKENAKHIKSSPNDQGHSTHQRRRVLDYESVNKGDTKNKHSEHQVPAASLYKFSIRNHSQLNLNPTLLSSHSASKQTFEQAGTESTNETLSNIRKIINFRHTDPSEEMLSEIPADISAKLSSFSSAQSLALSIGQTSTVHSLTDKDDENSDSSTPTNQPSSPMAESPLTYSLHSAVDVCDRKGESKNVVSSEGHERVFCLKENSVMALEAPSVMSTPSKRDSPLYSSLHPSVLCINHPIIKASAPLDVDALDASEDKSSQSSIPAKSGRGEILPPDTVNRTDSDGCAMEKNVHSSLSVSQQSRPASSCQIVNEMCTTLYGKKRWNQTSEEEPRSKMPCHQLKELPPFSKSSSTKDINKGKSDNHNSDAVHCNSANDLDVTGTWEEENLVSSSCFKHSAAAFSSFAAVSLCHCGAMHSKGLSEHNQKNTAKSQNPHEGLEHFKGVEQMDNHLSACSLSSSASNHCGFANYMQSAEDSESLKRKVGSNLSDCDSCSLLDPFKGGHDGGGFRQETPHQGNFCKHAFSTGAAVSTTPDVSFQKPVFSLPSCDDLLQDTNSPASSDAIARFKKYFQDEACNRDQTSDQVWSCDGSLDGKDIEEQAQQHKTSLREQARERSSEHSFSVRAKSTPNFASSSTKSHLSEEKENTSLDLVTRGRLASRDKSPLESSPRTSGGHDQIRHRMVKSASMMFHSRSNGLPSQSSPAPIKRRSTGRFDYDETLTNTRAIKNALSMSRLVDVTRDAADSLSKSVRILSTSAPASTNCLLGNFEESILNGRLEPAGVVDGFTVDIGASGSFCPPHISLPVTAYFFNLSDDNAPSPYLGHVDLEGVGKKGYHIPRKGTLQVTLFNPNKTVVKMFVVMYDLADMPPHSQTVIRQRTVYMPVDPNIQEPAYLRYLIHLRVTSSTSGKIYLHTDVRLIFARHKFELDTNIAQYELRSFTETPVNPKYSPKK